MTTEQMYEAIQKIMEALRQVRGQDSKEEAKLFYIIGFCEGLLEGLKK